MCVFIGKVPRRNSCIAFASEEIGGRRERGKRKGVGGGKSTVCVLSFFLQRLSLCVRKVSRGEISAAVPPLSVAAVPRVPLMGEVGENIWRVIA